MKQLLSQLTMLLLSGLVLLLTITKESEGKSSQSRDEINIQQTVEKGIPLSKVKTEQDSFTRDQSPRLLPLTDAILAGKNMQCWIY